jgi:hypothetical protein
MKNEKLKVPLKNYECQQYKPSSARNDGCMVIDHLKTFFSERFKLLVKTESNAVRQGGYRKLKQDMFNYYVNVVSVLTI